MTQATASTGIQAAAEAKLGEDSWQLLEVSLASLPQPITPGLYSIDPKLFASQMLIASGLEHFHETLENRLSRRELNMECLTIPSCVCDDRIT